MSYCATYFNEHDKFAAQWLRNLFPAATVDERDIRDVTADDVVRFRRVHFFGGIGGWEYALQLAGWGDEPVWTGSCPCQPFSSAGKRKGVEDERHLWPEFRRLIAECRPATIFGEQVASKDGREWLAGVRTDLEALGYAVGAADLCAASQGAPHIRARLFWVGHFDRSQRRSRRRIGRKQRSQVPTKRGEAGRLAYSNGQRSPAASIEEQRGGEHHIESCGVACRLANGCGEGLAGLTVESAWQEFATAERSCGIVECSDSRARRIPVEPEFFPLAHGIPRDLGRRIPELRSVAASARANRVGRLRGYGNAIVPQVAAEFIGAFLDTQPTA